MKRSLSRTLLGTLALALSLAVGCSSKPPPPGGQVRPFEGVQLNVFNWSNYIDEELLEQFKAQTGADVQYDNFAADEELEAKLARGAEYDVVFPSDRSVHVLARKGLLAELDHTQLPNWHNLDPAYLGKRHDPKNAHTAPYFWGTLAVGIRTDHVKGEIKGFEPLFDPKYKGKIAMLDSGEHCVAAALLHLGLPMNSTSDEDMARARDLLVNQRPLVQAYTNDFKDKLVKGEAWVVLGWSGDILQAAEDEKNIKAIVPERGTLLWVDSMAIPKAAKNAKLAHAFINFMLDADVAARNARYVRYATPNRAARDKLDPAMLNDPAIYPPAAVLSRCQWLEDRGQAITKIEAVWRQVQK